VPEPPDVPFVPDVCALTVPAMSRSAAVTEETVLTIRISLLDVVE